MCLQRYEAEEVFRESVLSTSPATASQPTLNEFVPPLPALPALTSAKTFIVNADIDKDGTRLQTFVRGKIKKYVLTAPPNRIVESTETLDDNVILRVDPTGQFNGRVDPDTVSNPPDTDGVYRGDWLF